MRLLRYDFDQSLIFWTSSTSHALERALNEELAPYGITYRQWQVLGCLALEGELSQVALAERMRIEAPTLAGILDRMERDGWIERHACPGDRRKKLLRPTPRVAPVWETITEAARLVRARAAAGLSPEQLQALNETLATIQRNLREESPAQPPETEDKKRCRPAKQRS